MLRLGDVGLDGADGHVPRQGPGPGSLRKVILGRHEWVKRRTRCSETPGGGPTLLWATPVPAVGLLGGHAVALQHLLHVSHHRLVART